MLLLPASSRRNQLGRNTDDPMQLNFREGTGRLGIVVSVLGCVSGGIFGYLTVVDTRVLSTNGFRQESIRVNYVIASLLPVLGFWAPWEVIRFLVWIWSGFSEQLTVRGQGQTRPPPGRHKRRSSAPR